MIQLILKLPKNESIFQSDDIDKVEKKLKQKMSHRKRKIEVTSCKNMNANTCISV